MGATDGIRTSKKVKPVTTKEAVRKVRCRSPQQLMPKLLDLHDSDICAMRFLHDMPPVRLDVHFIPTGERENVSRYCLEPLGRICPYCKINRPIRNVVASVDVVWDDEGELLSGPILLTESIVNLLRANKVDYFDPLYPDHEKVGGPGIWDFFILERSSRGETVFRSMPEHDVRKTLASLQARMDYSDDELKADAESLVERFSHFSINFRGE